jgi:hypothetical protein
MLLVLGYAESSGRASESRRWDVRRLDNGGSGATAVSYVAGRVLATAEVAGPPACQYLLFMKRRRKTLGKWSPGTVGALFIDAPTCGGAALASQAVLQQNMPRCPLASPGEAMSVSAARGCLPAIFFPPSPSPPLLSLSPSRLPSSTLGGPSWRLVRT